MCPRRASHLGLGSPSASTLHGSKYRPSCSTANLERLSLSRKRNARRPVEPFSASPNIRRSLARLSASPRTTAGSSQSSSSGRLSSLRLLMNRPSLPEAHKSVSTWSSWHKNANDPLARDCTESIARSGSLQATRHQSTRDEGQTWWTCASFSRQWSPPDLVLYSQHGFAKTELNQPPCEDNNFACTSMCSYRQGERDRVSRIAS